ncbi:leucine-rich repeat protein lrrA-like isoform X3 [Linepithema humile]|uniref:leucine-rich repeat protein lrrA-like isoform X3 n=1 Tax=Linepithema humile TaxID=83485 RepID=UPI000623A5CC|nr:PREDICTED: leucine-rich repeat protein lrrA-like isoform X3 [Linepithema humile]
MVQNIAIVEKTSSELKFHEFLMEKKKLNFEKESLYCVLTLHTPFRNLVNVTLGEYEYILLPKEFGTLHHLQEITLFTKCFVNTAQFAWEWLEQAPVRSNLKLLKIMNYSLPELPLQITCLKNLTTLNIANNGINFLPKEFGNLPLSDLNLSFNYLKRQSKQSAMEWLMQASIRNNLKKLNLSFNYLTEFPLQITYLKNLRSLYINNNRIKFLPKELGTLPHLTHLNLSCNHLWKSDHNTWEWLKQIEIRNKLSKLDLSDNLLRELPPQIGKLSALTCLSLARNLLECVPHSLPNLKNLKFLDLSNNDLLYLPGNMAHLSACIYVDRNPFNLNDDGDDDLSTNLKVPSLEDCSAEFILKTGIKSRKGLSPIMVRFLDNKRYCFFCETPCFRYYRKRFINYFKYGEILDLKFISYSLTIWNAKFECYACSSECAKRLSFN